MFDHQRLDALQRLILDYVQSPSLRHLRDPKSIDRLARQIMQIVDREPSVWRKWEGKREEVLRAAALCWLPSEDLRDFLNSLPGPTLTLSDVVQRLRAIHDEPYNPYPTEVLREPCLGLYARELSIGTELPAIIGALQEFVDAETERLRVEWVAARRQLRNEEREDLQRRFLAGADCKWTSLGNSKDFFTRRNGRAYRLVPLKNKRWELFRIQSAEHAGNLIGTYGSKGEASKALAKIAYEPEPRW